MKYFISFEKIIDVDMEKLEQWCYAQKESHEEE